MIRNEVEFLKGNVKQYKINEHYRLPYICTLCLILTWKINMKGCSAQCGYWFDMINAMHKVKL